jgi:hypothetical protein
MLVHHIPSGDHVSGEMEFLEALQQKVGADLRQIRDDLVGGLLPAWQEWSVQSWQVVVKKTPPLTLQI